MALQPSEAVWVTIRVITHNTDSGVVTPVARCVCRGTSPPPFNPKYMRAASNPTHSCRLCCRIATPAAPVLCPGSNVVNRPSVYPLILATFVAVISFADCVCALHIKHDASYGDFFLADQKAPCETASRRFPTRVLPLTRHGSEVTLYLQPCCHTVTLRLAVALSSLSSQGVAFICR